MEGSFYLTFFATKTAISNPSAINEATPRGSSHASGSAGIKGNPTVRLATYPISEVVAIKNPIFHAQPLPRYRPYAVTIQTMPLA